MIANQILQLKENLDNSRRAVSFMGGTVGENPAFDNLAAEIDSIPVGDANYVMVVDDGVVFRKDILPGALPNAKLVSVGGMTHKSKNLINIPFIDATTGGDTNGFTISVNWSSPIYVSAEECATTSSSIWRFKIDYTDGSSTYVMDNHLRNGGLRVAASESKVITAITYRNTYITEGKYSGIMISYGETRVPYEPYYEGLRDTRVTAVRVLGADGTEKARHELPASITALDGWGKGLNGYANTYNFESGIYTKHTIDGETLLETPIIENVRTTFNNILNVEGGGSIEFINEHNQSAPSDLRYMRRLV